MVKIALFFQNCHVIGYVILRDTTGEDCCPQCKAVGIAIFLCFMLSHSVSYVADNARPLGRHPGLSTY